MQFLHGAICVGLRLKRPTRIALGACALHLLLSSSALAAAAPPFDELLRQSQERAPRLAEARANLRVAEGLAEQARAFPNPSVSVEVEDIGARDGAGVSLRQNTYSLSQPIEIGGKRGARVAVGRAELSAAKVRARLATADFAYDLRIAYAAAEATQGRVRLLEDDLGRARDDLRAARALVEAGKEADLRAVQAEAGVAAADADLQAARAERDQTLARLTALSGSAEPFTDVPTGLLAGPSATPAGSAPAQPAGLAVAQAEREAARSRLRIERLRMAPDLTVSIGARTYESSDDTAVVFGVSAPLPLFDRNRGAVKAASAQVAAAEARVSAARLNADAAWRAATSEVAVGQARLLAAEQGETAAREAYRLARIGYDAGKASLIELSAARRALVDAQNRLIEARLARVRAEAQLARLTGAATVGE